MDQAPQGIAEPQLPGLASFQWLWCLQRPSYPAQLHISFLLSSVWKCFPLLRMYLRLSQEFVCPTCVSLYPEWTFFVVAPTCQWFARLAMQDVSQLMYHSHRSKSGPQLDTFLLAWDPAAAFFLDTDNSGRKYLAAVDESVCQSCLLSGKHDEISCY